jgi:hypothetical protein
MTGTCALCGNTAPLIDSHFMPAALYQDMNEPNGPIKHMIVVTMLGTFQSAEQFQMPLLCQACEIRFQKGGEDWTLANRYRSDGSFPLRDLLLSSTPETEKGDGTKIFEAANVSGLMIEQLIYFAASLFWRAGIADWKVKFAEAPKIDLTTDLTGKLRDYLLGQGPFPAAASVFVLVDAEVKPQRVISSPAKVSEIPYLRYEAHIPGMIFELAVDVLPPLGEMSLDSPIERIILTPLVTQRVKVMGAPLIAASEPKGSLKKHFPR